MYASRWRLFVGIGFLTIPVSVVVAFLQGLILNAPEVAGVSPGGEGGGVRIVLAALVSFCLLGTSILLVLAATTHAVSEIDSGNEVDVRQAYRGTLARWRPLLGAFAVSSVLVGALSLTVVLSPVALALVVLFALFVPAIVFEGSSAVASLRRSAALVRTQLLKTAILLATSILLAAAIGPILGTILILLTGAPFPVANVVSGVTFAFLMPYVALTMAYLYFDARVSAELARDEGDRSDVLPAEIGSPG